MYIGVEFVIIKKDGLKHGARSIKHETFIYVSCFCLMSHE